MVRFRGNPKTPPVLKERRDIAPLGFAWDSPGFRYAINAVVAFLAFSLLFCLLDFLSTESSSKNKESDLKIKRSGVKGEKGKNGNPYWCRMYMGVSKVPDAGIGVFAGRDFRPKENFERTPSVIFPQFNPYTSDNFHPGPIRNFCFEPDDKNNDLSFGALMLYNHCENCGYQKPGEAKTPYNSAMMMPSAGDMAVPKYDGTVEGDSRNRLSDSFAKNNHNVGDGVVRKGREIFNFYGVTWMQSRNSGRGVTGKALEKSHFMIRERYAGDAFAGINSFLLFGLGSFHGYQRTENELRKPNLTAKWWKEKPDFEAIGKGEARWHVSTVFVSFIAARDLKKGELLVLEKKFKQGMLNVAIAEIDVENDYVPLELVFPDVADSEREADKILPGCMGTDLGVDFAGGRTYTKRSYVKGELVELSAGIVLTKEDVEVAGLHDFVLYL